MQIINGLLSYYIPSHGGSLVTTPFQALLSVRFAREEYWSGLSFPSLGGLLNPGIEPCSPVLQADILKEST